MVQTAHFGRFFWGGGHAVNPLPLDLPVLHYKMPAGEDWKDIFGCLRPGSTGYDEMIGRIVACYRRKVDTEVLDSDDHEPAQSIRAMLQRALDGVEIQCQATVHAHPGSTFPYFV